jgi:hypothetical protein
MFSNEIIKCLKHLDVMHYGVYPCDSLPYYIETPAAIVVNSEPHTDPGLHWMAMFININRELDFFDSYGRPPGKQFTRFIRKNSRIARFNTVCLQDLKSSVCGHYCAVFLYFKSIGASLNEFISLFTNNTLLNDRNIINLYRMIYCNGYKRYRTAARSRGLPPPPLT